MNWAWVPHFLQSADALFPTGAYAHSFGFEEVLSLTAEKDADGLLAFLREQVLPAQATLELPYLRAAADAASAGDLDQLCALDRAISAWKFAQEARQSSAQLGTRRLRALRNIQPAALLADFEACISAGEASGHHLVVSGLQTAVTETPLSVALAGQAYQALAATCSAALKLMRIGQDACQRALATAAGEIDAAVRQSLAIPISEAGCFNPLLEIAAMRHAHASERLFIS